MMFATREEAGRRLGHYLKSEGVQADLVMGLPRGGVVVAAEVAHILELPLDVLIVRKIGHPLHREFAVGALAENGVVILDEAVIASHPMALADLEEVVEEEKERLRIYQAKFHGTGNPNLTGKTVLLVDDGLATGATTEAAVLSAKKQDAGRVVVAAPVASQNAVDRLTRAADEVQVMYADPDFEAVGAYYDSFLQTTDEEVLELLKAARQA
jgi:predicted phosphoribosyltransferase